MALTVQSVLDRVDDLEPNYYNDEYKLSWLYEVELMLWQEIFTTHAGSENMTEPEEILPITEESGSAAESGSGETTGTEAEAEEEEEEEAATGYTQELQVGPPYGRDIYENWLKAKISQANGETGRYNEYMTLFYNAWKQFADCWNRAHRPLGRTTLRM